MYLSLSYLTISFLIFPPSKPYCRNCHLRLFSTQDLRHGNLPTTVTLSPTPSNASSPVQPGTPSSVISQTTGSGARIRSQPPVSPSPTGNTSPRFKLGGSQAECPKCQKAVYHAEQVREWHCHLKKPSPTFNCTGECSRKEMGKVLTHGWIFVSHPPLPCSASRVFAVCFLQ